MNNAKAELGQILVDYPIETRFWVDGGMLLELQAYIELLEYKLNYEL
jgi:hypothetical protein